MVDHGGDMYRVLVLYTSYGCCYLGKEDGLSLESI